MQYSVTFPTGTVEYLLRSSLSSLPEYAAPKTSIIITDDNLREYYAEALSPYRVISIGSGEQFKTLESATTIIRRLISMEAHRKTMLVGFGGGVITDITGFIAGVYMRGMPFGFVPTTLLAMVDAAIGGKNGVNLDLHKNMIGTIRQPSFILYDTKLLGSLEDAAWSNGFAEIIKYGCICDTRILSMLRGKDIRHFRQRPEQLAELIAGCVSAKNKIVQADEQETHLRKILNFGHTAGHAFEILHKLSHGQSVALGMHLACLMSEDLTGFSPASTGEIQTLIRQFNLPLKLEFNRDEIMHLLKMDKKRNDHTIDFVLLERTGKAVIRTLEFAEITKGLDRFLAMNRL